MQSEKCNINGLDRPLPPPKAYSRQQSSVLRMLDTSPQQHMFHFVKHSSPSVSKEQKSHHGLHSPSWYHPRVLNCHNYVLKQLKTNHLTESILLGTNRPYPPRPLETDKHTACSAYEAVTPSHSTRYCTFPSRVTRRAKTRYFSPHAMRPAAPK